jgi:hypothetical protein
LFNKSDCQKKNYRPDDYAHGAVANDFFHPGIMSDVTTSIKKNGLDSAEYQPARKEFSTPRKSSSELQSSSFQGTATAMSYSCQQYSATYLQ